MERQALVLYLKRCRDLEILKYELNQTYRNEKSAYQHQLDVCSAPMKWETVPYPSFDEANTYFHAFLLFEGSTVVVFLLAALIGLVGITGGYSIIIWLVCFGLPCLFLIPYQYIHGEIYAEYQKRLESTKAYNETERERRDKLSKQVPEIKRNWEIRHAWLSSQYNEADRQLREYYDMNIIPDDAKYRSLYGICYIYKYIATTDFSLYQVIISAQIDAGIQEIKSTIEDVVSTAMAQITNEVFLIRQEVQSGMQSIQSNNIQMLETMRSMESSLSEQNRLIEMESRENEFTRFLIDTDIINTINRN